MSAKETYYAAEDVSTEICNLKAMLSAVDDKIRLQMMETAAHGTCKETVLYTAGEIQALLAIMEGMLGDAEKGISGVVRALNAVAREEKEEERSCA